MSELQAALLAIGVGVVVAVYVFGWWKQRQYSRKFGAAFRHSHDDALYQGNAVQSESLVEHEMHLSDDALVADQEVVPAPVVVAGVDETGADEAKIDEPLEHESVSPEVVVAVPEAVDVLPVAVVNATLNESCGLLDPRSDFIIELNLEDASPGAVLNGLWQRKFDFRKPVQVCGLTFSDGKWERVIAESQTLYTKFRVALQLVDRGGVISAAKLADFRDLVLGIAKVIQADSTVPDIQTTHQNAQTLDAFCAEVDRMVGVNLVPHGTRQLNGRKIAEAAALQGMKLESDGAFHLLNPQGNSLVTLINKDTKPFQHHTLEHFATAGITLLLDAPRVESPAEVFDLMLKMARAMAGELQVNLVDDHNAPLTESGLAHIRTQIAEVEAKMRENSLVPGSAQALRLFS